MVSGVGCQVSELRGQRIEELQFGMRNAEVGFKN
jgi:hypothetical protein